MAKKSDLPSITFPGLPWESAVDVTESNDFSSPGDFLQQVTNFQFQINATRIIFSTLPDVRLRILIIH